MQILLVEDDIELARQLEVELAADGHHVTPVHTGPCALRATGSMHWDAILLDVGLPCLNGFELVERLREHSPDVPVVFLTAYSEVSDRVRGLLLGGDDYLTKPFAMDELKARLRVIARRNAQLRKHPGHPVPAGWSLDPLLREVTIAGMRISLQPKEWTLLQLFLEHPGEILTKSFLLDRAWGIRFDPGTNVIDAVVCRLRRKLEREMGSTFIQTVRGRGYVFRVHV